MQDEFYGDYVFEEALQELSQKNPGVDVWTIDAHIDDYLTEHPDASLPVTLLAVQERLNQAKGKEPVPPSGRGRGRGRGHAVHFDPPRGPPHLGPLMRFAAQQRLHRAEGPRGPAGPRAPGGPGGLSPRPRHRHAFHPYARGTLRFQQRGPYRGYLRPQEPPQPPAAAAPQERPQRGWIPADWNNVGLHLPANLPARANVPPRPNLPRPQGPQMLGGIRPRAGLLGQLFHEGPNPPALDQLINNNPDVPQQQVLAAFQEASGQMPQATIQQKCEQAQIILNSQQKEQEKH